MEEHHTLQWIKENWGKDLTYNDVLYLYELIGYESYWINPPFACGFIDEWKGLWPLFNSIFTLKSKKAFTKYLELFDCKGWNINKDNALNLYNKTLQIAV